MERGRLKGQEKSRQMDKQIRNTIQEHVSNEKKKG